MKEKLSIKNIDFFNIIGFKNRPMDPDVIQSLTPWGDGRWKPHDFYDLTPDRVSPMVAFLTCYKSRHCTAVQMEIEREKITHGL